MPIKQHRTSERYGYKPFQTDNRLYKCFSTEMTHQWKCIYAICYVYHVSTASGVGFLTPKCCCYKAFTYTNWTNVIRTYSSTQGPAITRDGHALERNALIAVLRTVATNKGIPMGICR